MKTKAISFISNGPNAKLIGTVKLTVVVKKCGFCSRNSVVVVKSWIPKTLQESFTNTEHASVAYLWYFCFKEM